MTHLKTPAGLESADMSQGVLPRSGIGGDDGGLCFPSRGDPDPKQAWRSANEPV